MHIIYEVTNNLTGDTYVGLTRLTAQQRWARHKYAATSGVNTYFYRAIRKHGADNFSVCQVASVLHDRDAGLVERQVIQSLFPVYNSTNGGEVTFGRRAAPTVVAKIAASNRGKKRTFEQKSANSFLKKQQFAERPELKAIATAAILSARLSVDNVKRIAAVRKARVGKPLSSETRAKISKSRMGMVYSQEIIQKMANSKKLAVVCHSLNVTFDSVSEAAEHTGLSISGVSSVCRGKRRSANGLIFSFA
jgi:group I intron endonuclease